MTLDLDAIVAAGGPWVRAERIGDCLLLQGDCREVMPVLPKVCAVLTDPPYGIGESGDKRRYGPKSAAKGFSACKEYAGGDWDRETPAQEVFDYLTSFPAIIWGGNYFMSKIAQDASRWLIWHKKGTDKSSFADCEMAWTNLGGATRYFRRDWVGFGAINSGEDRQHRTQKPLDLMEWCLGFLPDARTILDPFAGSFTTAVACQRLGRQSISIEMDPAYYPIGLKRVQDVVNNPPLFKVEAAKPKPTQKAMDI